MSNEEIIKLVITSVFLLAGATYIINHLLIKNKRGRVTTKFITRTAIFAALSTILYITPFLKFHLPFFPGFLEIHLDEIPLLIAGFAYGPWCGIFALAIKTIIKLPLTSTMCVGELADFIYSLFFILPSALFYKKHRNFKGALLALSIGTISQIIAASFITTFLILDFYMVVMHLPEVVILNMVQKAGINITSLSWPFLYSVGIPFNAFKDIIVVLLTLLLYKRFKILIEKIS